MGRSSFSPPRSRELSLNSNASHEAQELRRRLGRNVRRLRLERGLTQGGLADLTGLSTTYISLIETGSGNPRTTTLEALASALGVSAKVLLSSSD